MKSIKDVIKERMDIRLKSIYSAIDLLLLEPEEKDAAQNLYLTCCERGLVKNIHS